MYKISISLFLATYLFAIESQNFTFLTKSLKSENFILDANSSVTFFGDKHYINSKSASYDLNVSFLTFNRAEAIKDSDLYMLSDKINLNLKSQEMNFNSMFLFNPKDNIWLNIKNSYFSKDKYELNNTITSSCKTNSPSWSIQFDSGNYDVNNKWVNLYHPKFYVSDIPIFYLPYFGFSTFKERSTGLLRPNFSISTDEGIFYSQPIFIAPQKNWDIELIPQIRTNRGYGIYSTLRFVDSLYSYGELSTGYFTERGSYRKKFNLKNDTHYGTEFVYKRNKFLSEYFNFEDGLYLNGIWLNDIDYLNLKKSMNYSDSTSNILTSNMNYYIKNKEDYYGIYSKYFIDTAKESNKNTLQDLPTLHYHKFSKPIFDDFLYSLDFKFKNHYREEGATAREFELLAPVNFYTTLLNEYLTLKLSENIYLSDIQYNYKEYDSGYMFKNYHNISLSTDLLKEYESFFHSMLIDLSYNIPSFEKNNLEFQDFIPTNHEQEDALEFKFMQLFYDKIGNLKLTHRVTQALFFDDNYKYGNLENEFLYNLNSNLKLYNQIYYSHKFDKFISSSTSFDYKDELNNIILTHLYKDKTQSETNFLSFDGTKKLYKNYETFSKLKYDFHENFLKSWEVGISMKKQCWDYRISYKEELNPILTADGSNSIKNKVIYFQINLIPLGGVRQKIHRQSRGS